MRQRYYQQQQHQSNSIQKSTFLPMLCSRPSIKNVTIPKSQDYSSSSCSSPLSSLQEDHHHHDPLSPKISCIGQVKRHNKIIGFPITTTTTNHSRNNNNNNNKLAMVTTNNHSHYYATYHMIPYFKLKRLFSSKSLTTTTTRVTTPTKTENISSSGDPRRRRRRRRGEELVKKKLGEVEKGRKVDEGSGKGVVINIVDLDPPLPVIKKKQESGDKTENLWKRRSGGLELGNLQLQRVRPNLQHQMMQLTTV